MVTTVRRLMFEGSGRLVWEDVADPPLVGGDALVRPDAVAVCDLDAAVLRGGAPLPAPFAFGHEFAGTVVVVGAGVRGVRPGDRVASAFQICCGACLRCRRGHTANCDTVPPLSSFGLGPIGGDVWGGAFADVVRVPFADAMLVPLPEGVTVSAGATAADNLADAYRAVVPHLLARPGARVLVAGGGAASVGLWAAELAVLCGGVVDYLDADPGRRRLAEEGGASAAAGPTGRWKRAYDITVDATGDPDGLRTALLATARDGICTSVSVFWRDVAVPLLALYSTNVTFMTGRVHSRAALPLVLDLIARGSINPMRIARVVGWSDVPDALLDPAGPPKTIVLREVHR